VGQLARVLVHETAHWCAARGGEDTTSRDVEEGDVVERALFGGVSILEDCSLVTVSSYGDKPCFSCLYVVRREIHYGLLQSSVTTTAASGIESMRPTSEVISDDPNLILLGMRLTNPPLDVTR